MIIKEISCKSLLNKSGISDYCINPYTGCQHACAYCYARFMKKYTNHQEAWGSFVDVKTNAVEVLKKELVRKKRGEVMLSSVTDAYQPLEKKYELTRNILKELLNYQFPISILTKSALVLRDIDIIKKFDDIKVEFTIPYLDEKARMAFEPGASSINERLQALKELKQEGIKTGVFFGPIMPILSEKGMEHLFDRFAELEVALIYVDRLNIKCGNWPSIENVLRKDYPELIKDYNEILFGENREYYEILKKRIIKLLKERHLNFKIIY
ncbi:MAG: radical SAM protein [Candidatus Woesearchaeota archaeon]|nr:radical SAM protein [Candidatus Woesearchaeota archaeon]